MRPRGRGRSARRWLTHDELPVLLLQPLVALSQLVGHQFVLVPLLLTRVQLLGQDEQSVLLALQLSFAHQELQTATASGRFYDSRSKKEPSFRSHQRGTKLGSGGRLSAL